VASHPTPPPPHRRGSEHQRPARTREQTARRHAAAAGTQLARSGWPWGHVATFLDVAGRTLRRWTHDLLGELLPFRPLGRPVPRAPRERRNDVLHLLDEVGPGVGLPTLRDAFDDMTRAELDDLLRRYRRVWRERHRQPLRVLHWPEPGRVWAIDFTQAPSPVDGRSPDLLAVRDLATGYQLLWQPIEAATSDAAARHLDVLFATHGAPLVLKCDNGSPFVSDRVRQVLLEWRVETLVSPPYTPRYNGGIEAGIGSLKARTADHAARVGHPGHWTADDLAAARDEANAFARPFGATGPSPTDVWTARPPIATPEREHFTAGVERHRREQESRPAASEGHAAEVRSERGAAREAVRLALEECGYLYYTRRRVPPPIPRPKVARVT
jgi:transposase InsO family protein